MRSAPLPLALVDVGRVREARMKQRPQQPGSLDSEPALFSLVYRYAPGRWWLRAGYG